MRQERRAFGRPTARAAAAAPAAPFAWLDLATQPTLFLDTAALVGNVGDAVASVNNSGTVQSTFDEGTYKPTIAVLGATRALRFVAAQASRMVSSVSIQSYLPVVAGTPWHAFAAVRVTSYPAGAEVPSILAYYYAYWTLGRLTSNADISVRMLDHASAWKEVVAAGPAPGATVLVEAKWDGADLWQRVGAAPAVSTPSEYMYASMPWELYLGWSPQTNQTIDAVVGEPVLAHGNYIGAELAAIRAHYASAFGAAA